MQNYLHNIWQSVQTTAKPKSPFFFVYNKKERPAIVILWQLWEVTDSQRVHTAWHDSSGILTGIFVIETKSFKMFL